MSFDTSILITYLNDGKGKFRMKEKKKGASDGFATLVDINNDDYEDIVISGLYSNFNPLTAIYINNKEGSFTMDDGFGSKTFIKGSISIGDIEKDNNPDILMTGVWGSNLFLNSGKGKFTLGKLKLEEGNSDSSLLLDVDNDNDLDIYITGKRTKRGISNNLYLNNGKGEFEEIENIPFEATSQGRIIQLDIDNDSDMDIFVMGRTTNNQKIATLYIHDGKGNYNPTNPNTFEGVTSGAFDFADIDGDRDLDLIISGINSEFSITTALYINQLNDP